MLDLMVRRVPASVEFLRRSSCVPGNAILAGALSAVPPNPCVVVVVVVDGDVACQWWVETLALAAVWRRQRGQHSERRALLHTLSLAQRRSLTLTLSLSRALLLTALNV